MKRLSKKNKPKRHHGQTGLKSDVTAPISFIREPCASKEELVVAARKRIQASAGERTCDRRAQLDAAGERDEAKMTKQAGKLRNKIRKLLKMSDVKLLTSKQTVTAELKRIINGNNHGLTMLRNQLRVRRAVYGQEPNGVLFGPSGNPDGERARLKSLVFDLVDEEAKPEPLGTEAFMPARMTHLAWTQDRQAGEGAFH